MLEVTGLVADEIGARAWTANIRLQELTPMRPSLEETFMNLTRDAVEYSGAVGTAHELHALEMAA